jgi:hypothetical protein
MRRVAFATRPVTVSGASDDAVASRARRTVASPTPSSAAIARLSLTSGKKWGRRIRNLIAEHSATLGLTLSADSQAAGRWSLDTGAEYYAAGVGTGIAGFRAKLGLIDDPIRSRQDADSELIRDRIWNWYINDFKTRLVPHAAEILIQTRFQEDDLAGRALNHELNSTSCSPYP